MKINEKNLCVFATTPPYDVEGFLSKRGEVHKAFQRRYFVLKGNLLFYFEKKGDREPLGLIIVEGCTIELSEESDQYCFEIAFDGNRTYVLLAENQESMETWMKALTCAGYEYKRLIVAELQRQLEELEGSQRNREAPKPPPRRQNPFNRPAPPVPTINVNNNKTQPIPYLNGHLGLPSQRESPSTSTAINNNFFTGQREQSTNSCKITNKTHVARTEGNSEFFVQEDVELRTGISPSTPVFNQQPRPSNNASTNVAAVQFAEVHEKFRDIVMRDIIAYRREKELKDMPLIEF